MTRSTFERVAGRWLAALMALATWGVVGASTARASGCAGHDRGRSVATYLDALGRLGLDDLRSPKPVDSPRPCTGASCSGLPSSPSPATPETAGGLERWALAPRGDAPSVVTTAVQTRNEPILRSIIQADPIFHPPRLAAMQGSL
jgi:hypothetical protein